MDSLSPEALYGILIVGLFVVARALERLRLPAAITCVGLGAVMGMGYGLFREDQTIPLLSTLGIVTLFLHAGLDVDLDDLARNARVLASFLLVQVVLLTAGAFACGQLFGLPVRPAFLMALALLTPSTGFILDALPGLALDDAQRQWVKTKAIAAEILALIALFYAVQSTSFVGLVLATSALAAMIVMLPFVFAIFARFILPYAPKSEFTFLVIVASLCAFLTRTLGVYYLVGAFVVGVTAVSMRKKSPELLPPPVLFAVELFASFFVPFYFFKAGVHLDAADFTLSSVGIGVALLLVTLPVRIAINAVHRRITLGEPIRQGARVGLSLVPTLVFTIVIADILRERHALAPKLYGALMVYTLANTMLPGLFLFSRAPRNLMAASAVVTGEPEPLYAPDPAFEREPGFATHATPDPVLPELPIDVEGKTEVLPIDGAPPR